MFRRSLVYVMLIVCVFSFCSIHNISYAGTGLGTWDSARTKVFNAERVMRTERDQYHVIQDDLKTLIGQWDYSAISNANQRFLAVIATAGAIISVASGGSLYPAAYVLSVTIAKTFFNETKYSVDKTIYLLSMGALVPLMDAARANVNAAYYGGYLVEEPSLPSIEPMTHIKYTPGYVPQYDAYLKMAVSHLNEYEYYFGISSNQVTLTFEDLESSVKGGTTSGYFHRKWHDKDTQSIEDHVFEKFMTFADFVVKPDLPLQYKCYGKYSVCRAVFRTPFEAYIDHRVKCGSAELSLHNETMKRVAGVFSAYSAGYMDTLLNIVIKRASSQSCSGVW